MNVSRKGIITVILLSICLIIHVYGNSETRVENGYSTHFFVNFSALLRSVFGKIPFSIGDIVYGILVCWLIWKIGKFFYRLFTKQPGISKAVFYKAAVYQAIVFCCIMYIIFNIFWGINYNRVGIAGQLGLPIEKYTQQELIDINRVLAEKVNGTKNKLIEKNTKYPTSNQLYGMVSDAYKNVATRFPFLQYQPVSFKSSMWGWLGNYTGFTGYYNPFTGEAQLNTTIPKFIQPFVACHEVGHQLGYAKEMEANFVGYLAAANSGNDLLQYSVYLDLFIYANRNLYYTDSTSAKGYRKALSAAVITDLKEWAEFNRRHRNFIGPVISWIYDKYLQGNMQPSGLLSYDEVTGFIIAYYKKFGTI